LEQQRWLEQKRMMKLELKQQQLMEHRRQRLMGLMMERWLIQ
jgi:hypothetical protein